MYKLLAILFSDDALVCRLMNSLVVVNKLLEFAR